MTKINGTGLLGVLALLAAVVLGGCGSSPPPPAITPNLELEALKKAAAWGDPAPEVLVFLATEYLQSGRDREALAYFAQRSAAHPEIPGYRAIEALFEARLADDVFILKRVAYVEATLAKLDDAVARDRTPVSRFFRALVLAELPARFGRAEGAVRELTELAKAPAAPSALRNPGTLRTVYLALSHAYRTLGRAREADAALSRAALPAGADGLIMTTPFAVDRTRGTRYAPRAFESVGEGVFVASNFDFSQIYFVVTPAGVVAIDAGTTPVRAREAKAALREHTALPITHVILTHAHWDHLGGLEGLVEPGTKIYASKEAPAQLAITNATVVPRDSYFGAGAQRTLELHADHFVDAPERLTVGGTDFELLPLPGGETEDSMVIHVPSRKVLFAGDVLASVGSPPSREGSPEHFVSALRALSRHADTRILHGHDGIDWVLPQSAFPALADAFASVEDSVLASMRKNRSLSDILKENLLPDALQRAPGAVAGYLMYREMFIRRLYQQRAGFWAPDGSTVEVIGPAELASAIDLVAGGDPARLVNASEQLLARGDYALAAHVAELGVRAHPSNAALGNVLRRARLKLLEKNQLWDFFKVTEYSELSGTPISPAPSYEDAR